MHRSLCILLVVMAIWSPVAAEGGLDEWLDQDQGPTVEVQPGETIEGGRNPFGHKGPVARPDAVPGVIVLSNGKRIPGYIFTTRYQPLLVYVEQQKRWRRVPLLAVLAIEAVVVEEKMELEWRWKATGEPERVYTGRKYPNRRLQWKLTLIDGTEIVGAIKGRPIWIEYRGVRSDPFVLSERSKGKPGQELSDLVYVRRILVSRRVMQQVAKKVGREEKQDGPPSPGRNPKQDEPDASAKPGGAAEQDES